MAKIIKKCIYCGGEIKPVEDFFKLNGGKSYEEMKKEIKKLLGKYKESENFNCIECGVVYDKYLKPTNMKLGWLKNG